MLKPHVDLPFKVY